MRLNQFIAQSSDLSRRGADAAIHEGRVLVNGVRPSQGQQVTENDNVTLDGQRLFVKTTHTTIMMNKPVGYVCSRAGQGSKTIYELLPEEYQHLQTVGRLDKNSSGLLLLTNDGRLANELTHPRYQKIKIYEVQLDKPLQPLHQQMINDKGIVLEDGISRLQLEKLDEQGIAWRITMQEGRNRQIRRTFSALNYKVLTLQRTNFGSFSLSTLKSGEFSVIMF